jgi:adenosylhomocysteine nucleosidase
MSVTLKHVFFNLLLTFNLWGSMCINLGNAEINNVKDIHNLLIIVAMDAEEKALTKVASFNEFEIGQRIKIKLKHLSVGNRNIYLLKSGIGLQMAYAQAFYVLSQIPVDSMILFGVGGALKTDLNPGDAILGTSLAQHDSIAALSTGNFPMLPGAPYVSTEESKRPDPILKTHKFLTSWIEKHVPIVTQMQRGLIVSGSQFAANSESKNLISKQFGEALLVDMEASSVALLAQKYHIPFAVLKTVADRCAPKGKTISQDYLDFLTPSSERITAILSSLIQELKN